MFHLARLDLASAIGGRTRSESTQSHDALVLKVKTDGVFNLYTREVTDYV
jgi:hypothetical protein